MHSLHRTLEYGTTIHHLLSRFLWEIEYGNCEKEACEESSGEEKSSSQEKSPGEKSPGEEKGSGQKAAAKKPAKKAPAKIKKSATKRKPNAAFMKAMNVSPALGAVIGNSPAPRTEVTKKIWAYIKKNDLQDSKNRRMINADDKLLAVFGGKKQVSMFEMTKLVSKHLK